MELRNLPTNTRILMLLQPILVLNRMLSKPLLLHGSLVYNNNPGFHTWLGLVISPAFPSNKLQHRLLNQKRLSWDNYRARCSCGSCFREESRLGSRILSCIFQFPLFGCSWIPSDLDEPLGTSDKRRYL